jgi:hypothetical protein
MSGESFSIHSSAREWLALRRDTGNDPRRRTPACRAKAQRRRDARPRPLPSRLLESLRHAIPRRVQRQRPEKPRRVPAHRAGHDLAQKHELSELVMALFALPFILFSMAGGFLADRRSKRTMTIGVKVFEVFVMLLALAGFMWRQRQLHPGIAASWETCWPLLACVFLMGVHSAIFGPSKYGSLPELLPERKLSWGNGCSNSAPSWPSFSAPAAPDVQQFRGRAVAVRRHPHRAGGDRAFHVPRHHPRSRGGPGQKIPREFPRRNLAADAAMRGDRPLWLALIGNTYFSFLGQLLLLNLFFYGLGNVASVTSMHIGYLSAAGAGHRPGQRGGRVSFRRQNRIRPGAARRPRHVGFPRLLALPCGSFGRIAGAARGCWVSSAAFSSCRSPRCCNIGRTGKKGRGAGHGQPAVVRRHFSRVGRALAAGAKICRRAAFFSSAAC